MPRHQHWTELPAGVRHEVERHIGPALSAYPISDGSFCDLAVTLETATGRVFCKGGESAARPPACTATKRASTRGCPTWRPGCCGSSTGPSPAAGRPAWTRPSC
jgi:hypothetical protein